MIEAQNLAAPRGLDPPTWLAQYEAIGGSAHVIRWHGEREGLWLGIRYPRDEAGQGWKLLEVLHDGNASGEEGQRRSLALQAYIIATRGVMETPRDVPAK